MIGMLLLVSKWLSLLVSAALFFRLCFPRRHDQPRCRECRYDMTGAPGLTCPECGRIEKNERGLHRRPRRISQILLIGALLCLSYTSDAGPHIIDNGWTAAIPSTLLVAAYPVIESHSTVPKTQTAILKYFVSTFPQPNSLPKRSIVDHCWYELETRARGDRQRLSGWQRRWLINSATSRGSKSDVMLLSLGGWDALSNRQRDRYLSATLPGMLNARPVSALGAPMYIEIGQPGAIADLSTEIAPRLTGCVPVIRRSIAGLEFPAILRDVGVPMEPADGYTVDVRISDEKSSYTWTGEYRINASVLGDIDSLLPVNDTGSFNEWLAIEAKPKLKISHLTSCLGPSTVSLSISAILPEYEPVWTTTTPAPAGSEGIVLDADIELLVNDECIGRSRMTLTRESAADGGRWWKVRQGLDLVHVRADLFWEAVESERQIMVRFRAGNPTHAQSAFSATTRWEGEVIIPLESIEATDLNRSTLQTDPRSFRSIPINPDCIIEDPRTAADPEPSPVGG